MSAPQAFLKFLAKASLNAVGGGFAGDFAVEVLPEISKSVWLWWGKDRKPEELKREVEAVAALPLVEIRRQAAEVVAQEAAGQPETVRQVVTAYLAQVPNAIRQSQRRPAEPSGRSVSSLLSLSREEDLLCLLPSRPPHFKLGDRPIGLGEWELEELLGMGGFGEVWKARNPYLPTPVALKFCLDPAAARVLRNEAAVLGRVMSEGQHPRIVRLLDTHLNMDPPCLKYEYVAGGDLAGLIYQQLKKNQGRMPPNLAVKIISSLARAMRNAHKLNPPIVHRDLKPANILAQPGADGLTQLRITDFGIGGAAATQAIAQAKGVSSGHFLATALRGTHTPLYASPQQMAGADPDPRDDVYALGVIWYQMLVGDLTKGAPHGVGWRRPFFEQGVAADVLDLLQECFEDEPTHRPADAGVLAQRLDELGKIVPVDVTDPVPPPPPPETKTAAEWCRDGDLALERGDATQAIRAYTQALKRDDRLAVAYRKRACAHLEKGNPDKAIADLTALINLDPQSPEGYLLRGSVHREHGAPDKALGDFTKAITLGLRSAAVYIERGLAYADKSVFDLAFADFGEALCLEPGNTAVYLHRGRIHEDKKELDRALADYTEAIRLDAAQGRFFNARGLAYLHKGDADLALADLIRALHLDPGLAEAYHNRGQVYARKGDYEQAIADYTQAIKLGVKSASVYYHRGLAQSRRQKAALAIADFGRALKLNPRSSEIYLMRGLAYCDRADYAAAIADFTKAIQRDKGYTAAYQNRGRAYLECGQHGKAIKDLTKVIEQRPGRADAYDKRAWAHCLKKQFDPSIADATEAIRLNPACASAYFHRSRSHAGKGELDPALADATESIRLDARPAHYEARGLAYHEKGEYDLAIADFTEAIKLDSKNAALYRSRSRAYAKMGDAAKSRADKERCAKLTLASAGAEAAENIVASLIDLLRSASEKAPVAKTRIVEELRRRFPDQRKDTMGRSISLYLKDVRRKGHLLRKNENGYWLDKAGSTSPAKAKRGTKGRGRFGPRA